MNEVADHVTDNWRFMGHALGIDDHKLDHIDKMCLHPKDKALSTLDMWCTILAGNTKKDILAECLQSVGRKDIADKIREMD